MAVSTLCHCSGCLRHVTARRAKLCENCSSAGCTASSADPESVFDEGECKARKRAQAIVKKQKVS